jgi:Ras-related protein Rab-5C
LGHGRPGEVQIPCTNVLQVSYPLIVRKAIAALVVYDVTSADSFEKSKMWLKELNEKAPANIQITLVGNKIDLDQRMVSRDLADSVAKQHSLPYFEVSAKENIGIDDMFRSIAKSLPQTTHDKKVQLQTISKQES